MPKLKINNTEIEVPAGTSILQAAEMLGYEIPRFCYHDKLSVPANCRMCLVEVKGAPKPVASCAMACGENMEVVTDSPMITKARHGVMEMMLINHPLDCPICDQGGECDLQDQAYGYGFDRSRYAEDKRAKKDPDMGPLIKTVMTRCIQCTRCVRFSEEIAGVSCLGMLNRGEDAEITTFVEKAIASELSGNLVDVCPVGALTNKPYAFTARPWELRKTESIDVHDAVGSNIRIDARGNEVMRVLPRLNEDVNEEWLADKSRYAIDGLKKSRLDRPYVRDAESGALRPATWDEALTKVAEKLMATQSSKIAAMVGALCESESILALKDLMLSLGVKNIDCRTDGTLFDVSKRCGYVMNSGIAGIDEADAVLLVGTNPRHEAPLVNARIRKSWLAKRTKVGVIGEQKDLTYPCVYIGVGPDALAQPHSFFDVLKSAKKPMIIVGQGAFLRPDGEAVHAALYDFATKMGVVKEGWNGFNVLQIHASRVGALDLGFIPQGDGLNAYGILTASQNKELDVVYLMGVDEFNVEASLGNDTFVIYQGHHGDQGAVRADIVLPGAAYTEKDGLYVNTDGRVQMAKKAVSAPGDAREDWKIIRALSEKVGKPLPYDSLHQLRARMVKEFSQFGKIGEVVTADWKSFGKVGDVRKHPFHSPIDNYYMTNSISRLSPTMSKCTAEFVTKPQLAEAAE
ncbi:MAG: NADH-quinone oxidoreductase subunit NuoG [Pseudobdellovibrionaceae bacterium]|jgi:NADH-quinone oxidoreductase subunit G|nr:NADH-quinone oxidoreductase subunit NuoG [Pseudobdellovibrionaceae bacterium]